MQDKIYDTFRRLFENRDPELMKILDKGRDSSASAFTRQVNTPISSFPSGTMGFIVHGIQKEDTKKTAIKILENMVEKDCDKGEILQRLNDLCGWQGLAQMFHLLLSRSDLPPLDTLKTDDDLWEMSAKVPQYHIKVEKNQDFQHQVGGFYKVWMCDKKSDGEGNEVEIRFTSRIHKAIYIWMLLHPRQAMTRAQINEGMKHSKGGTSFYNMLYKSDFEDLSAEQYTQAFSHIKRAIKTAWNSMGSRGDNIWYNIEGGTDKSAAVGGKTNEENKRYYINLIADVIDIREGNRRKTALSLEDFRMTAGTYTPIDEIPQS